MEVRRLAAADDNGSRTPRTAVHLISFKPTISQKPSEIAMDQATRVRYEARAKIMKAMAHPARLLIVDELSRSGERCVCELTEMVGSDMSTVSRHLALLKGAGLVEDEKRGQMVFYRLRVKCVTSFFTCIESVIACNAQCHQALLGHQEVLA